jgi:IS30 family transposase
VITIFAIPAHHGKEGQMMEDKLNNRPRKSLNWKTPNEVFYAEKIVA